MSENVCNENEGRNLKMKSKRNEKETIYPECEYRYNPIGYELCDYGNYGVERHKKHIATCCANVCPLGKYPESMKMTCGQRYKRDMKKLDNLARV